ncbi:YgiT-type zinc finger protein [Paenibacillus sp. GCM10027629]|uniref:YgiT-type zinc finger protein n=1 Tax=Paenibacillus sp. GCM10027629 TaxID=3273414 RepID=UPI003627609C
MKCPICKSTLVEKTANARRVVKGQKFTFKNIPAYVCENELCGQIIFDSLIIEELDEAAAVLNQEDLNKGIIGYEQFKERLALLQVN